MAKQLHRSKSVGKSDALECSDTPNPLVKDTQMAPDTVTPEENDPLWDELGNTRVSGGHIDSSLAAGADINTPANFTEMSPSLVLGKDVLSLGDFKLLKKLGEGAMGAVYKAKQVSFDRVVALKILFPHVANNPKLVERLYREGLVMGRLDHPNIVQAYAIDKAEGFHYVAMEYVPGQSTQKWLNQIERFPVGDAVRIILDCATALAYAHSLNMVHRDIKPDNILLTRKGAVKVADLGMVKIDDEEMSLTQTGHAVGTPWFMPLEQARNAKEIDGRSDIYALGCTLYAFLVGHPPFIGRTIVDVIHAKESGNFDLARKSNSDVPERLDLIIAKMTAKLAKNRYQTCEEVIKDLESLGLANETLSFLSRKPGMTPSPSDDYESLGKTNITAARSRADVDFAASASAPALDPDLWYVQMNLQDGAPVTRRFRTAQLKKMLIEGTILPTASASHHPSESFRTLGTYKEFQGGAMGNLAKKAADKNTARYRGIFKKIEDDDRERAIEEKKQDDASYMTTMQATRQYYLDLVLKYLPYGLGAGAVVAFIAFIAWMLRS